VKVVSLRNMIRTFAKRKLLRMMTDEIGISSKVKWASYKYEECKRKNR
jgi:hypothetical protein